MEKSVKGVPSRSKLATFFSVIGSILVAGLVYLCFFEHKVSITQATIQSKVLDKVPLKIETSKIAQKIDINVNSLKVEFTDNKLSVKISLDGEVKPKLLIAFKPKQFTADISAVGDVVYSNDKFYFKPSQNFEVSNFSINGKNIFNSLESKISKMKDGRLKDFAEDHIENISAAIEEVINVKLKSLLENKPVYDLQKSKFSWVTIALKKVEIVNQDLVITFSGLRFVVWLVLMVLAVFLAIGTALAAPGLFVGLSFLSSI